MAILAVSSLFVTSHDIYCRGEQRPVNQLQPSSSYAAPPLHRPSTHPYCRGFLSTVLTLHSLPSFPAYIPSTSVSLTSRHAESKCTAPPLAQSCSGAAIITALLLHLICTKVSYLPSPITPRIESFHPSPHLPLCVSSVVVSLSFASHPAPSTPSSLSLPPTPSATFGAFSLPPIKNEPMLSYAPNSPELRSLQAAISSLLSNPVDVPIIVHGREIRTSRKQRQTMPSNHSHTIATYYLADESTIKAALDSTTQAKASWEGMPWQQRAAVYLKAADLLSTKYRWDVLAATILGQGKNAWQAEIDAAAETADFWRYSVKFLQDIYHQQPVDHSPGVWNRVEYRPLEGFVYAISPFNFAAIGANLSGAPAIMGNTVIWKPSGTAILSNYLLYKVMEEAGMPPGVINFVPEDGPLLSSHIFASPHFAGLHFTGSTRTFQALWQEIGAKLPSFRSYPRIVGETGGKNFHMVHPSADKLNVLHQTIRSAFEYSGQKCSACSRMYLPKSWWVDEESPSSSLPSPLHPKRLSFKTAFLAEVQNVIDQHMGQPHDPSTLVSAVIDKASFDRLHAALEKVKAAKGEATILVGGGTDSSKGWFVQPTVVLAHRPDFFTLTTELFGPILTVYLYEDSQYEETLRLCNETSPYALTGSIFCAEPHALGVGMERLRHAAGNFYVNDKSTGAVVGQQPFGGARGSGTNDKAGGMANLLRWVSPRSIKENFLNISSWKYPSNSK